MLLLRLSGVFVLLCVCLNLYVHVYVKGEVWGQLVRESLENGCNCCFIRPVILLPPLVVYMV